jgi:hypothetical protein
MELVVCTFNDKRYHIFKENESVLSTDLLSEVELFLDEESENPPIL